MALWGGASWLSLAARAQEPAPQGQEVKPEARLEERLEELDQKVRILERKLEMEREAAADNAKDAPSFTAGRDGFSLKSADGNFQLKLRGYVHADARFFINDTDQLDTNTFLLRRVRPILEGTFYKIFDFRIMPDFGGGTTVLQDAYLDTRIFPELKLRIGKFKPPVGLERLQPATDMRFIERGYPTNLVPNRDVGAQLFGDFLGEVISYQVGIFNGVVDGGSGDIDNHDEKDGAARIFVQPFRQTEVEPLQGLGFGVAGTLGNQQGALPTFKSTGQATIFSYAANATADGQRWRGSPQLFYTWGPLGVLAEYAVSNQEVKRAGVKKRIQNESWQVALSYVLTGEKQSFKAVDPKDPFGLSFSSWGAWELLARVGSLRIDQSAFPAFASAAASVSRALGIGGGVNWYLNRNVKWSLDYEWQEFRDGKAGGNRENESVILTRVQFAF